MSKEWVEGVCNESTGFLFRHQCQQFTQNRCGACNKPVCDEHSRQVEGNRLCLACDRAESRNRGLTQDQRRRSDYDPYYDSGTYYTGYGHHGSGYWGHAHAHGSGAERNDPNDLHAGDAESLRHEGDEEFESDMNES